MSIKWKRSHEGFCESHDGRWSISPEYQGYVNPQFYMLKDNQTGKCFMPGFETQSDAKWQAQKIIGREQK